MATPTALAAIIMPPPAAFDGAVAMGAALNVGYRPTIRRTINHSHLFRVLERLSCREVDGLCRGNIILRAGC